MALSVAERNGVFAEREETSMIREMVISKKMVRGLTAASLWEA